MYCGGLSDQNRAFSVDTLPHTDHLPPPLRTVSPNATRSTIRRAMVCIMHSVATPRFEAGPPTSTPAAAAPAHGGEVEDHRRIRVMEMEAKEDDARDPWGGRDTTVEGCWSEAVVAAGGGKLPSDASTCLLWCAIALGALVRGCPLTDVGVLCLHRNYYYCCCYCCASCVRFVFAFLRAYGRQCVPTMKKCCRVYVMDGRLGSVGGCARLAV